MQNLIHSDDMFQIRHVGTRLTGYTKYSELPNFFVKTTDGGFQFFDVKTVRLRSDRSDDWKNAKERLYETMTKYIDFVKYQERFDCLYDKLFKNNVEAVSQDLRFFGNRGRPIVIMRNGAQRLSVNYRNLRFMFAWKDINKFHTVIDEDPNDESYFIPVKVAMKGDIIYGTARFTHNYHPLEGVFESTELLIEEVNKLVEEEFGFLGIPIRIDLYNGGV